MVMKLSLGDQVQEQGINMNIKMSVETRAHGDKGEKELTMKIDTLKMDGSMMGASLKYDSEDLNPSDAGTGAGGPAGALGEIFGSLVGKSQKMIYAKDDKFVKMVEGKVVGADRLAALGMDSKTMFQQLGNSLTTEFPTKPVKKGDVWTNKQKIPMQGQEAEVSTKYKLEGEEKKDGKALTKISFKSDGEMKIPTGGAGAAAAMKGATFTGTMYYDQKVRRIVSTEQKMKATLSVQQGLEMPMETSTSLKLVSVGDLKKKK